MSGPTNTGGKVSYLIYNKCSEAYRFKVYLYDYGLWAYGSNNEHCMSVGAYSYGTYWYTVADPNWLVYAC